MWQNEKETGKMAQYLKLKKKMWNLVVSKPENKKLTRKTAKEVLI